MKLTWARTGLPKNLASLLETLGEEYSLQEVDAKANLVFEQSARPEELTVRRQDGKWFIRAGRSHGFARGVGLALAGVETAENIGFETFGFLFDCTRGNVVTVDAFKRWLRRLALMGYNVGMIYVKDAYQLPGEPFFGLMRGAYSQDEIRAIDAYAQKLGIEIMASIQALGHVEPIMQYWAYHKVKDTSSTLLVDEPATYVLLEKMIGFWSEALDSRRIHLGMDETHDLGRGRFMDLNGYEPPISIYNRHLAKVCEICDRMGLKPIIWADMFFRFANKTQSYYDTSVEVAAEVRKMIPPQVQLSYWDYYHRDKETYATMLTKTRNLNDSRPFMASGVWTWSTLWTDYEQTAATVKPCIDACREVGADELIFTLWGDDGGHCDIDSALAGLAMAADYAYKPDGGADGLELRRLYQAVCGTAYDRQLTVGSMILTTYKEDGTVLRKIKEKTTLWDDPLMGMGYYGLDKASPGIWEEVLTHYRGILAEIDDHRDDNAAGDIGHACLLLELLIAKIEFRRNLLAAYQSRDREALSHLASGGVDNVITRFCAFGDSFRRRWFLSYKSYGLELFQIRMGAQIERFRETSRRIEELLAGKVEAIDELDYDGGAIFTPTTFLASATGCFFV
ncbi:MAG TPA: family 20 glycosylhydrolase [Lentisphaeria bacterium]|nr:family 20 glycosylhydrolase [Lentisphaeria bacterium]